MFSMFLPHFADVQLLDLDILLCPADGDAAESVAATPVPTAAEIIACAQGG